MYRIFTIALFLSLLCWHPASADQTAQDAKFEHAVALMKEGDCRSAGRLLEEILRADATAEGPLWNAGLCAKLTGDYAAAADYFTRYKKINPDHLPAWENLVQVYQAAGEVEERDRARRALIAFKERSTDPEVHDRKLFVRDWARIRNQQVYGLEYFNLKGPRAVRYSFPVVSLEGDVAYKISLGSYETTNQVERELGRLPPGVRLFHLDAYVGDTHYTLGFFEGEPDYDTIRPVVMEIVAHGDPADFALSSSRMDGKLQ